MKNRGKIARALLLAALFAVALSLLLSCHHCEEEHCALCFFAAVFEKTLPLVLFAAAVKAGRIFSALSPVGGRLFTAPTLFSLRVELRD